MTESQVWCLSRWDCVPSSKDANSVPINREAPKGPKSSGGPQLRELTTEQMTASFTRTETG